MVLRVLVSVHERFSDRLAAVLRRVGASVRSIPEATDIWEVTADETFDLIVVDRDRLPHPVADSVVTIRSLPDRPDVVILQEREDAGFRAAMLGSGALAVLSPELPDAVLVRTFGTLLDRRRETMVGRWRAERPEVVHRLSDFASSSRPMGILLELARKVTTSDTSLLILGETGVGKEWLARAIHEESARAGSPFIAVNCAAIPDELLESELFGHERGAFTGALRARRGAFELAHGGTLFLDEIADMSPHLQAKLLRVLQEKRIQRLGAETSMAVDIRIMAATNRDLESAIREGHFRRDLYYRLGVVSLLVPPLRERREDIPLLAESYLEQFRVQLRKGTAGIHPDALRALLEYSWPGNVRELINVMERAVLLCATTHVGLADLPEAIARSGMPIPRSTGPDLLSLSPPSAPLDRPLAQVVGEAMEELERSYLEAQLEATGGRVGETARRSGLAPRSLYRKMRHLGLRKEDYRSP